MNVRRSGPGGRGAAGPTCKAHCTGSALGGENAASGSGLEPRAARAHGGVLPALHAASCCLLFLNTQGDGWQPSSSTVRCTWVFLFFFLSICFLTRASYLSLMILAEVCRSVRRW